ncbi:MAG: hypothetical protein ACOC2J_03500 [bacterium]
MNEELFYQMMKKVVELSMVSNNMELTLEIFDGIINYIMNVRNDVAENRLREIADKVSSERGERIMTLAEKLRMEGMKKGKKEGKKDVAISMLKEGLSIEQIAKFTKLDKGEIELLKDEIKH